ncbi:hypothetical protein SETIT_7G176500v2 [Setaria italica]|uniref:Uncharacterized protein n=1 Tax=Setaria italica TaxID=4555 RepID=A0A368RWR3_SETIT|nr:hypothetical protein SETIT_7G176500v2 [Setaria italica]
MELLTTGTSVPPLRSRHLEATPPGPQPPPRYAGRCIHTAPARAYSLAPRQPAAPMPRTASRHRPPLARLGLAGGKAGRNTALRPGWLGRPGTGRRHGRHGRHSGRWRAGLWRGERAQVVGESCCARSECGSGEGPGRGWGAAAGRAAPGAGCHGQNGRDSMWGAWVLAGGQGRRLGEEGRGSHSCGKGGKGGRRGWAGQIGGGSV